MANYNTVAGLIQFDPTVREAGTQVVTDILIQSIGSGGANVKITLWPEFEKAKVEKGDFVVAQGKFEARDVNGTTYYNLSANTLVVNGKPVKKVETERLPKKEAEVEDDEQQLLF